MIDITGMIDKIEFFLADRGIYTLTILLFAIGIFGMISCSNYVKN